MSDELDRRQFLMGLFGFGGGYAASQYIREDEDTEQALLPSGAVAESFTFGEWAAHITTDWDAVSVDEYPTLVAHVNDGVTVFSDGQTYQTTLKFATQTMEGIITSDPADVQINNFPALLFETTDDGSTGSVVIFQEGDL